MSEHSSSFPRLAGEPSDVQTPSQTKHGRSMDPAFGLSVGSSIDASSVHAGRGGFAGLRTLASIVGAIAFAVGVGGAVGWIVRGSPGALVGVLVGAIGVIALMMTLPAMSHTQKQRFPANSIVELKQTSMRDSRGGALDQTLRPSAGNVSSIGSELGGDHPTLRSGFFPVNKPTRASRSGGDL